MPADNRQEVVEGEREGLARELAEILGIHKDGMRAHEVNPTVGPFAVHDALIALYDSLTERRDSKEREKAAPDNYTETHHSDVTGIADSPAPSPDAEVEELAKVIRNEGMPGSSGSEFGSWESMSVDCARAAIRWFASSKTREKVIRECIAVLSEYRSKHSLSSEISKVDDCIAEIEAMLRDPEKKRPRLPK